MRMCQLGPWLVPRAPLAEGRALQTLAFNSYSRRNWRNMQRVGAATTCLAAGRPLEESGSGEGSHRGTERVGGQERWGRS